MASPRKQRITQLEMELAALRKQEHEEKRLKAECEDLLRKRRGIDERLRDAVQKLAKLGVNANTGQQSRREQMPTSQKLHHANIIYVKLRASRNKRFQASELQGLVPGLKVRQLIHLWNVGHTSSKRIQFEGRRKQRKYWVS